MLTLFLMLLSPPTSPSPRVEDPRAFDKLRWRGSQQTQQDKQQAERRLQELRDLKTEVRRIDQMEDKAPPKK